MKKEEDNNSGKLNGKVESNAKTRENLEKPKGEKTEDEKLQETVKTLDQAFFAINFYPVATKEENLGQAKQKIKEIYENGGETVRQMVLYMIHEQLSKVNELKTMHNFEHWKQRHPNSDTAQTRVNVYRSMFNYTMSLEGIMELIHLLGELKGDDAAKVLTYHFSFYCGIEIEATHMLRNVIIESLGESESPYALKCLLRYAKYTDNERIMQRISMAVLKWDEKLEMVKLPKPEKEKLKKMLEEVLTLELAGKHYG